MSVSAYQRLRAAEVDYLVKSGWERVGATRWASAGGHAQIDEEDALRLQKQHDATHVLSTFPASPTRRLVVEVTDKGAVHYEQMTRDDAHKFLDEYPLGCEYKEHLLRADLEAKAQKDCADDLAKELLERNKQLSDTEVELEKSRALNKNREAEYAECTARAAQLHTEVCLERNKLRSLNKDLTAELGKHKSRCKELLAQLEESEKSEATLRDQLEESRKIEAELRA